MVARTDPVSERFAPGLEPLLRPLEALREDPANARTHDERNLDAIVRSLSSFGQRKPIVVREGVVVAGNGTLRAARSLGWTYIVDDPDFVDMEQEPGLRKAAKAILDVKSQKQYLFEVGIASPWKPPPATPPVHGAPTGASTSRWAGMSKRITLSSALRTTQFEASTDLQVFKVTWDVLGNRTVLEAGTASGWMAFEGIDIS